jgi:hypothetical protein
MTVAIICVLYARGRRYILEKTVKCHCVRGEVTEKRAWVSRTPALTPPLMGKCYAGVVGRFGTICIGVVHGTSWWHTGPLISLKDEPSSR